MSTAPPATRLSCGSRVLDLSQPQVMGILNVTPDSFSDGGRFLALDAALRHAQSMASAGAALIDVGGESTRPGARPISAEEELARVAPVVEAIAARLDVVVSVDTSTPLVMRECAALGAGLINDVRALRREGALEAAVETGLAVCLMHMRGEPGDMQGLTAYADLIAEVGEFLDGAAQRCLQAGIPRDRLVLDPGFGFAKSLRQNLLLLGRLADLQRLGYPLLVGVSRKSMIGSVLGRDPSSRLPGSLALAALAVEKGARIIRAHDVAETLDVVRMVAAVERARLETEQQ